MKKKIKDIKSGDIVVGFGIITEIDLSYDDPFWQSPHCTYFDYNDPYHGRVSRSIDPEEECEIMTNPKQITHIYQKIDNELVKCIKDREAEREILKGFQGGCPRRRTVNSLPYMLGRWREVQFLHPSPNLNR